MFGQLQNLLYICNVKDKYTILHGQLKLKT